MCALCRRIAPGARATSTAIVIVDLVVGPLALTLVVRVVIILQGVALVVFVVLVVGLLTSVVGHDVRSVETVGTWPKFVHVVITSACLENFHEDMQPLTCPPPTVSTGPPPVYYSPTLSSPWSCGLPSDVFYDSFLLECATKMSDKFTGGSLTIFIAKGHTQQPAPLLVEQQQRPDHELSMTAMTLPTASTTNAQQCPQVVITTTLHVNANFYTDERGCCFYWSGNN